MGRWLVSYFLVRGYEVHLHDIQQEKVREIAESSEAKLVNNLSEDVGKADLIVLSTPIDVTPGLLEEINIMFPNSATVMKVFNSCRPSLIKQRESPSRIMPRSDCSNR